MHVYHFSCNYYTFFILSKFILYLFNIANVCSVFLRETLGKDATSWLVKIRLTWITPRHS
jgi:hypothetical protein